MIANMIVGILFGLFGYMFLKSPDIGYIPILGFSVCIFGAIACFISVIISIIKLIGGK